MRDYLQIEEQLVSALGLRRRPVAIALRDAAPSGVTKFEGTVPSGCTFWRLAAEGRSFYTVPPDHYNCPIGCHTHNIPLPPERAHELADTLNYMGNIGYVRMEEVPGIPRLSRPPGVIVYAPLGETPLDPDVVVVSGPAARVMLLQEAAIHADVAAALHTLGRPTCMAVPAALSMGMVASTGCIGNRVYTGIDESDLYVMVPCNVIARVSEAAATIQSANAALLLYHTSRQEQLLGV